MDEQSNMADDDVQITTSSGEKLAYKFVLSAVSAMVAESGKLRMICSTPLRMRQRTREIQFSSFR